MVIQFDILFNDVLFYANWEMHSIDGVDRFYRPSEVAEDTMY